MNQPPPEPSPKPYPASWESRAELRVFRTTADEWPKLINWRGEMRRRGWKLLKIMSEGEEIVAVFGRTKSGAAELPTEGPA